MAKKKDKKPQRPYYWRYLDAWFIEENPNGRWTSQEICDALRETVDLSIDNVNEYMEAHRYLLVREDDRLVWTLRHEE